MLSVSPLGVLESRHAEGNAKIAKALAEHRAGRAFHLLPDLARVGWGSRERVVRRDKSRRTMPPGVDGGC